MVTNKLVCIFCIAFNFSFILSIASQGHAINWILGYGINNDTSFYGRTILNFSNPTLAIIRNFGGFKFELGFENNSFSDDLGKLRFFYDGFRLGNAIDYNIIENGDTLNPGKIWLAYQGGFYPISDASVFIPPLKFDSILMLIHLPIDFYNGQPYPYSPSIYETRINMNSNGGKGKAISKNKAIFKGNISPIVFSGCRHSNGRDWWLIFKNNQGPKYYKFLYSNSQIYKIDSQELGSSVIDYSSVGNAVFSQDGKKFVRISNQDGIQIFNFDRCDGNLSNFVQIENDSIKPSIWVNVALSANNRFLYASTNTKIFQYDLEASNIQASMEIVGNWDGFIYDRFFTTSFCDMQLAADGKIYISCASGNIFLHVINDPDLKGKRCDFQLRAVTLPSYIACGLGNYPNYLLGPEEGSICDSLTSNNNIFYNHYFNVYPNPAKDLLRVVIIKDNLPINYTIYNQTGDLLQKSSWDRQLEFDLNIERLHKGLYFLQLNFLDGSVVRKFVKN